MRESHKHLMWFLLAVTAALWGFTHRVLHRDEPDGGPASARPAAKGERDEAGNTRLAPGSDGGAP